MSDDEPRSFTIQTTVNAAELDELRRAAKQAALSLSSYTRALMFRALRREAKAARHFERALEVMDT